MRNPFKRKPTIHVECYWEDQRGRRKAKEATFVRNDKTSRGIYRIELDYGLSVDVKVDVK